MTTPIMTLSANLNRLLPAKKVRRKDIVAYTGLSQAKVGRLMRGEFTPETETIQQIARLLKVKLRDLFAPAPQLTHIRFRSKKQRVNVRLDVLANTAQWLRNFQSLEDILDDRIEPIRALTNDRPLKDPVKAAERVRCDMGLDEDEPIYDICGLLETYGVKVYSLPKYSDAFFGLSVSSEDGGPAVVVNCSPNISVERWIFSAAHELAHLVLHRGSYDISEQLEDEGEEREADAFAGAMLMPQAGFDSAWESSKGLHPVDRVIKVKRHFNVSYRTIIRRLIDTGKAPDPKRAWSQFYALYNERTGLSLKDHREMNPSSPSAFSAGLNVEPQHLTHFDFQPERLSRLVREALEQEKISVSRAADVLGVTIEQMRELRALWYDNIVLA